MTTSHIRDTTPPTAESTKTKFSIRGRVADVIICFKFYRYRLRSFRAVGAKNGSLPLTLTVALTTSIHHRHCDGCRPSRHRVNIDILILYRIGRDRIEKCDIPKTPYGVRKI